MPKINGRGHAQLLKKSRLVLVFLMWFFKLSDQISKSQDHDRGLSSRVKMFRKAKWSMKGPPKTNQRVTKFSNRLRDCLIV